MFAAHRAQAIRRGGDPQAELPSELRGKRDALRRAEELVDDLVVAQAQLDAEHPAALEAIRAANAFLLDASRIVIAFEMSQKADQLEAADRDLAPIRQELRAFSNSHFVGPTKSSVEAGSAEALGSAPPDGERVSETLFVRGA